MFNENQNEPLILSIGSKNTTTRVVILKLDLLTNRWTKLQSLLFKQEFVKHFVINGELFLIGCSSDDFCAVYKWTQSQFRRHQKVNSKIFESIKHIYGEQGIVIVETFNRTLSFFTSEEIVSDQSSLELPMPLNIVDYAVVKSEANQNLFYAELILNKTSLAVNLYKVSFKKVHRGVERNAVKAEDVIECIAKLKSLLKTRFPLVQSSHHKVEVSHVCLKLYLT